MINPEKVSACSVQVGAGDATSLIAFQVKFRSKGQITADMVKQEAARAAKQAHSWQAFQPLENICLIYVAIGDCDETLKPQQGRLLDHGECSFPIPEAIDLFILSRDQLNSLLGHANVSALFQLAEISRDVREHTSFSQVASKLFSSKAIG